MTIQIGHAIFRQFTSWSWKSPRPDAMIAKGVIVVNSSLRELLGIVVAVMVMLLLAPLTASAHEGHPGAHVGSRAAGYHQHASNHHVSRQIDIAVEDRTSYEAAVQLDDVDLPKDNGRCTGGCCFGMGCCSATIASTGPVLDPPPGGLTLVAYALRILFSADRTSLFEPPTTLA